ncbi:MAG: UvrB/UvrC motif-containing protein [Gemmatimonadota bacterium]|jgi:protein arginine kinase activator|nr:UvrB/UvrC motif-containing protein [Gemmatimonadota bacterium]
MQCERCGENPAVINLTQIENNEASTFHLCESCATEQGLGVELTATPETEPLTDFLAQMGKGGKEGNCEFCGLGLPDFKRTGRLGCPHCYSHFDQHLRGLLRKLHSGTQHVGKVYLPPNPGEMDRAARIAGLRRSLQRSIEAEDFERAAALRDQIRRAEATERLEEENGG